MSDKTQSLMQLDYEGVEITCPIEEGHRMVPVRTVCQIIDVDYLRQNSWLKKHPYFSQLYNLGSTVGADGKQREMNCLPMFDLLSWLSSISENQRKEGSLEKQYAFMAWLRNEMLGMYKLIEIFQSENRYELDLIDQKEKALQEMEEAKDRVKEVTNKLKTINSSIEEVRAKRYTGQTALPFPEE